MSRAVTLALAVVVLAVALGMAAVSAWQRAGSLLDRALLVALACAIVAAVHLLPALVRGWWAWALWGLCFAAAVFGHAGFLTFAGQGAAESRHAQSAQVQALQDREKTIREVLGSIKARPVSVVAAQLSWTKTPVRRQALEAELIEARRAASLRDELVTVAATLAQSAATEGVTDPVTQGVARVLGVSVQVVMLVVSMVVASLVELLGAVLWSHALRHPAPADEHPGDSVGDPVKSKSIPGTYDDPLFTALKAAIDRGYVKPTVAGIRQYMACSQSRAMQIRRELVGSA